ncbi:helix-turn-helix transcriptional regulator [Tersicoccus phoenicis]|uniref:helix-turn-helix transcriptional regulator n=1 Tax=Tersicoccus phoenicis TaxID=554083 RepID=UPI001C437DC0|nr:helix-turn-helix domain-containing protein [Tersicoccus phoenicis]
MLGRSCVMGEAMLTRQQVADFLGVRHEWFSRHIKSGPPFYRLPGNVIRYKRSEVEAWLKQQQEAA